MSLTSIALALWLATALAPGGSGEQWRIVRQDGGVEARASAPVSREDLATLSYAWAWSADSAPRRVAAERIGKARLEASPEKLSIRVAGWNPRTMAGARILAGPRAMWSEIPEPLLPVWPVPQGGRIDIPLDKASPWRLRIEGPGVGSWWLDLPAGRKAAVLPAVAGPGFDLLVLDSGGRPLDGASLRLTEGVQGRRGGAGTWAFYAAGKGRIQARGLPDAEPVTAVLSAEGHAPRVLQGRVTDLSGTVRLGTGAQVTGMLADEAGKPLSGAQVRLEAFLDPELPEFSVWQAASGDDGAWKLAGVPPGKSVLIFSSPGRVSQRLEAGLAAGANDLGTIRLGRGVALRIAVVDDAGAPVEGAEVSGGHQTGRSDARGLAVLTGIAPGLPLEVAVRARGHVPARISVEPPFSPETRLVLQRAFTVRGRVLDAGGRPVPDGSVQVRRGNFSHSLSCAPDGRFESDLPPGVPAVLTVTSPATRELRVTVPAGAPGEERDLGDLRVSAGRTLWGRLVSARDGSPVAGGRVWAPRPAEQGELLSWADRDVIQGTSGEDGRFRLSGAADGPMTLRVDAAGFARMHLTVPPAGESPEVDLGDVALAEGATVRLLVAADGAAARLDLRGDWLEMDMLTAPVREGEATFVHVPPGRAHASVLRGGSLICERDVRVMGGEELAVECAGATVKVRGVVQVGGRPSGAGTLTWLPPALGVPGRIQAVVSPGGLRRDVLFGAGRPQVDVEVAADGSFTADDLSPGVWQVSWVGDSGLLGEPRTIEIPDLPEGSEYRTVLSFPGAAVVGVVVDERGKPAAQARVRDVESGALAWTGPDGDFELTGISAGKRLLRAERNELASPVTEVEVPADRPGEAVRLVLGPRRNADIAVRVMDADGSPAPGALAILEEEGKLPRLLTADAGGQLHASVEPPWPARVRVAALVRGDWALGSWQLLDDARRGLALAAVPTGVLSIETSGEGGSPHLLSPEGWDVALLSTLLGIRPTVGPELPWLATGLPAGAYTVVLDSERVVARVRSGERAVVRLGLLLKDGPTAP